MSFAAIRRDMAEIYRLNLLADVAAAAATEEVTVMDDSIERMVALAARMRRVMTEFEDPGDLPNFWHTPRERVELDEQVEYFSSQARFNINHSGRRSGKTWLIKAKWYIRGMEANNLPWYDPRFFFGAPTCNQAKQIFWEDLKNAIPAEYVIQVVESSPQYIRLINNATLWVIGFDKPARFEGPPWDGGDLDEYADMSEDTWPNHVRPALADRTGGCDFTGVPEGRNHFYRLVERHRGDQNWAIHHWRSDRVLPEDEIAQAKSDMDAEAFEQEFGGAFLAHAGGVYTSYQAGDNQAPVEYDTGQPLIYCFDFNVSPGVAVICQERVLPNGLEGTAVIGQVWIERNSTTPKVCEQLIADWTGHTQAIHCYGDASGGAQGTTAVRGSDWDLIKESLKGGFPGVPIHYHVRPANPRVRVRTNAVNAWLRSADERVRMVVNPVLASRVITDFEGVEWNEAGIEIDESDKTLGHVTAALGYYVERAHPIRSQTLRQQKVYA